VALPQRLSVAENLRVYGHLYNVAGLEQRIAQLAAELDLGDLLDRPSGKLSAGQKTRVALAKALINRPELLLLDEPTASLDPDTGDWVRTWLERYRDASGGTILLASHNMMEVERLCSHVLMLKRGRIVDRGSPQDLLTATAARTWRRCSWTSPATAARGGPGDRRIRSGHDGEAGCRREPP
jgi:ABC-2 type transport system ATP-binding protein